MRKIKWLVHSSLDGFAAGLAGEMDWIGLDEEIFDYVATLVDSAGTALYGRTTYEMMQAYWPSAGYRPDATKHDRQHSLWYNRVEKIVLSRTLQGLKLRKTFILGGQAEEAVRQMRPLGQGDILMLGSPSVARQLIAHDLIDTYWIFVQPVLLGEGIPLFPDSARRTSLEAGTVRTFQRGVRFLEYHKAGN